MMIPAGWLTSSPWTELSPPGEEQRPTGTDLNVNLPAEHLLQATSALSELSAPAPHAVNPLVSDGDPSTALPASSSPPTASAAGAATAMDGLAAADIPPASEAASPAGSAGPTPAGSAAPADGFAAAQSARFPAAAIPSARADLPSFAPLEPGIKIEHPQGPASEPASVKSEAEAGPIKLELHEAASEPLGSIPEQPGLRDRTACNQVHASGRRQAHGRPSEETIKIVQGLSCLCLWGGHVAGL